MGTLQSPKFCCFINFLTFWIRFQQDKHIILFKKAFQKIFLSILSVIILKMNIRIQSFHAQYITENDDEVNSKKLILQTKHVTCSDFIYYE